MHYLESPSTVLYSAEESGRYTAQKDIELFAAWKDLTRILHLREGDKFAYMRDIARKRFLSGYRSGV